MLPGQIPLPRFVHRFRDADIYTRRILSGSALSKRRETGKRYNFHGSRACQTRDEALIILGCGERERERERGGKRRKERKGKRKSIKDESKRQRERYRLEISLVPATFPTLARAFLIYERNVLDFLECIPQIGKPIACR